MDRREFFKKGAAVASLPLGISALATQASALENAVLNTHKKPKVTRTAGSLSWLEGEESKDKAGSTWGKSWSQGELSAKQPLRLISAKGKNIPLQTWPTAYWPDGSVKWTAHAVPANVTLGEQFTIEQGQPNAPENPVRVSKHNNSIEVDTGVFSCVIPTSGAHIISELKRSGKVIGQNARLIGLRQDKAESEPENLANIEYFQAQLEQVTIEQQGPVRAVIKISGKHHTASQRQWLPFTLRVYFYAGGESLRISHNFVFDGDDQTDFIKGLGLRFEVIQKDQEYNRHVRFVGENGGLWAESPKGITGLRRDPGQAIKNAQIAGIATPPLAEWDSRVTDRLHWIPVWNDYTLSQLTANGFAIKKRTKAGHAWIDADQGKRANGTAYLGGVSGGVLFGMRDFWQMHPVQIDIRNAGQEISEATIWFWSPQAPVMDVRFYHDGLGQDTYEKQLDALNITYEDYEPGFGSAHGVAKTTEFTLCVLDTTPSRDKTIAISNTIAHPAQVVAAPEDYLRSGVFGGLWSLPDRSSAKKKAIEDRLDWSVKYYKSQVDQRHWYGFWNYGDIMHTYDADRHVWRYDVGGYAWDNSELSPDLWLWYSFLRTGDAETFRLAEAMTRHNRDVDMYHLGRFKGLGSRHNVQHWGCSAKQMRISTAAYRRFHYFLTGDERTGDVLTEVIDSDQRLATLNATRKVASQKPVEGKSVIGVGTDFGSTAANWLTAWERTGDEKYRNWLTNAMQVIGSHPQGFFAGAFGYDANTRTLISPPDRGASISHLNSVFGLIEMCTELNQLLDVPAFKAAWLRYGRFYSASKAEQKAEFGKAFRGNSLTVAHSRLTAYVAEQTNDDKLAQRAWHEFSREWGGKKSIETTPVSGASVLNPVEEAAWVSTNDAAQWGLAAIQNLALIANALEK